MDSNFHTNIDILVISIDRGAHHHKHAGHRAALVVFSIISDVDHLLANTLLAKMLLAPTLLQLKQND